MENKDKLIEKIVLKEVKDRGGAHDFTHNLRVLENSKIIARTEKVNWKILHAMVLLHDIVRFEEDCEEESVNFSMEVSNKILRKVDFSKDEVSQVLEGIRSHSIHSKKFIIPKSIEAKVLFDADKIDALGLIGVARWIMLMGKKNFSLKSAAESYLSELSHFEKVLGGKLFTETGNNLAENKLIESRNFMSNLLKELAHYNS